MMHAQRKNQEEYRDFYGAHPEICVFSAPWWLDCVAGEENWNVVLVKDSEDKIVATFPYVLKTSRFGLKRIGMPTLTQKLGPFVLYPENISAVDKIDFEHRLFEEIISQLPVVDDFSVNFGQEYRDWLPF